MSFKRFLALLLAFTMMFSLAVPSYAFADNDEPTDVNSVEGTENPVDNTQDGTQGNRDLISGTGNPGTGGLDDEGFGGGFGGGDSIGGGSIGGGSVSGGGMEQEEGVADYEVTYYANDGTDYFLKEGFGATLDDTVGNLGPNEFERKGYVFVGWSKTAGGTANFLDEEEIRVSDFEEPEEPIEQNPSTLVLYAVWKQVYPVANVNYFTAQDLQGTADLSALPVYPAYYADGDFTLSFEPIGTTSAPGAYVFSMLEDEEQDVTDEYGDWRCDYVVSFDKAVDAFSVVLAGSYGGMTIPFTIPTGLEAGQKMLLISTAGIELDYSKIRTDVQQFACNAINLSEANVGTTITVSLVLWQDGDEPNENNCLVVEEIEYEFGAATPLVAEVDDGVYVRFVHVGSGLESVGLVFENGQVASQSVAGPHFTANIGVSSVTLDNELSLEPGATETLTAAVNGTVENYVVTWVSSDNNVATVNENGVVTAVARGQATITAYCGSGSASCTVTVAPKPTVVVDEDGDVTATIPNGVFETGADAAPVTIAPAAADNSDVSVTFNAAAAAAIAANAGDSDVTLKVENVTATEGPVTFEITMVKAGTEAEVFSGSNAAGSATVTVPFEATGEAPVAVYLVVGGVKTPVPCAYDAENHTVTFTVSHFSTYTVEQTADSVAKIVTAGGTRYYDTLEAAFADAVDGDTITLLANCSGNGIVAPKAKFGTTGLTVDFGGFTYTIVGPTLAGSSGTQTQAFQLLKGNKITFKDGAIVGNNSGLRMLIQNYSDLTLDNMVLDATQGTNAIGYVLSNNNGNVVIDDTTITAKSTGVAFDVCRGGGSGAGDVTTYPSVHVKVTGNSHINGKVELDAKSGLAAQGFGLTLESGTMTGSISITSNGKAAMSSAPEKVEITKKSTFDKAAPTGFRWSTADASGVQTLTQDAAKIGSDYYATLEEAIAAGAGKTITLLKDIALSNTIEINDGNAYTIAMNTHTISKDDTPFILSHGSLSFTGTGTVYESADDGHGAVVVLGSTNADDANYSVLNVGPNVTLAGWAGIFVRANGSHANGSHAYGVVVNLQGTAKSPGVAGHAHPGHGIYVNGNIADTTGNVPVFNITGTVSETSGKDNFGYGNGIYAAGYAIWNLNGCTVSGYNTAVELRSGELNINGGTYTATNQVYSTAHNGDGSTTRGAAIAIAQHTTKKDIDVTIASGTFTGTKSIAIANPETITDPSAGAIEVAVTGGTFNGALEKSDTRVGGFVTGGSFDEQVPAEYCAAGFQPEQSATEGRWGVEPADDTVASVGTHVFSSLAGAVAYANTNGGTVILQQDVALDAMLTITGNFALDLAGHTVTSILGTAFKVTKGALTVKDTGATKGGIVASGEAFRVDSRESGVTSAEGAMLTIESGVNVTSSADACVFIRGYATVSTSGNLTSNGVYATIQGNGSDQATTCNVTISGGSVTATTSSAVYFPQNGTLKVSGGTVTGYESGIAIKSGTLNVTGGTIRCTGPDTTPTTGWSDGVNASGAAIQVESNNGYGEVSVAISGSSTTITSDNGVALYEYVGGGSDTQLQSMAITGGTFTGGTGKHALMLSEQAATAKAAAVSGGTFSAPIALDYCANGYAPVAKTGGYGVNTVSRVAAIANGDGTYTTYTTISNAVTAAQDDDTIVLLRDSTYSAEINNGKTFTIDLNGHTMGGIALYSGFLTVEDTASTKGAVTGQVDIVASSDSSKEAGYYNSFTLASSAAITRSADDYAIVLWQVDTNKGYGSQINIYGSVTGCIWVMGNITNGNSVINVSDPADINAFTGDKDLHSGCVPAICMAGLVTVNVDGGTIYGDVGIEVRNGTLNVTGGTIKGAEDDYVVSANNSGSTSYGAGIAVAQHTTQQNIQVSISGNPEVSGYTAMSIANPQLNTNGELSVGVEGGTFTGEGTNAVAVILAPNETRVNGFISGGEYSSAVPEDYCAESFSPVTDPDPDSGLYTVTRDWLGSGTEQVPWIIANETDLKLLATRVNEGNTYVGKFFRVEPESNGSAIAVTGEWTAIGSPTGANINGNNGSPAGSYKYFAGTFDGNSKSIAGLTGDLFGATNGATIKNLSISGATIGGTDFVGAAVGYAYNTGIDNVDLIGAAAISGTHFVGGLVGYAAGPNTLIQNCDVTASGTISAADASGEDGDDVGGLVGYFGPSARLDTCTVNNANLKISGERQVGGLAGLSSAAGTITNCAVTGVTVECITNSNTSSNKAAKIAFGGLVGGFNSSCGAVSGSVTNVKLIDGTGAVTTNVRKGLVSAGRYDNGGSNVLPTITVTATGCTMEVSTAAQLQAIAAEVNAGNSYAGNTVKLTADINLSGIANWTPIGQGAIEGAPINGNNGSPNEAATWKPFSGVFDGNNKTISGLTITSQNNGTGLFGATNGATIKDLTVSGAAISGNDDFVGAVAGYTYDTTISNVDVSGTLAISGTHFVGGAVGFASKTTFSDVDVTDATGSVTAADDGTKAFGDDAGGLVGYTVGVTSLTGCDVSGITVNGARQTGGLVGLLSANSSVTSSTVSNVTVSCNANDAFVAERPTKITFGGLAGAMHSSNVSITNSSVSDVNLTIASNLTAESKAIVRMGYVTAGTNASETFAVTNNMQTGSNIAINNVTKPEGVKAVGTSSILIDGLTVTVTFNLDGSQCEAIPSQTIPVGGTATRPDDPEWKGEGDYQFNGWYLNNAPFDFDTAITQDITLTAGWIIEQEEATPAFKVYGGGLQLEGKIIVQIYTIPLDGSIVDHVTLTVNGRERTVAYSSPDEVDSTSVSGTTFKVFNCPVYAKEMDAEVVLKAYDAAGNELQILRNNGIDLVDEYHYTVNTYVGKVTNPSDSRYPVLQAMKTYGDYAEYFFEHRDGNTSLNGTAPTTVSAETLDAYAAVKNEPSGWTGPTYFGGDLLIEEGTYVQIYFNGSVDGCTFTRTDTNATLTPVYDADYGMYYVEIPNISAPNLDNLYTVSIEKDGLTYTVSYGALTYVRSVLRSATASQTKKDTVTALYWYWLKAESYFPEA